MSKDNPTQYHTRTIDLFVKSYLSGYASLNEAADIIFSANNLENHNRFVPSFIYDIENYLAKAKIATVESGDLSRREQTNIMNTRSQQVQQGQKHPFEAILMFDFDDWRDCAPDGGNPNPERRKELCQRFWSWQIPTKPREGSSIDAEDHPVRQMNWFHSQSHYPSSNSSSPLLTQMINTIFNSSTDGEPTRILMDEAMADMGVNPRLARPQNMGEWSNSVNEASYDKQFHDAFRKYHDKHTDKFSSLTIPRTRLNKFIETRKNRGINETKEHALEVLQNTALKNLFLQHKIWELRGVPDDYIWENLYDEGGSIDKEKTVKQMRSKSESRDSAKYRAGFFPMYFGLPLIDYEDGLKFAEWFLDGAGYIEGEDYDKINPRFNDDVINNILGHNARGFLTRHCSTFAHALHAVYSGNVGTSGHNSLPGGHVGRTPGQEEMGRNKEFKQDLLLRTKRNSDKTTGDVIKLIDEAGITREQQDEVLRRLSLLDNVGEGDKTPDYHAKLSEKNLDKVMTAFAQIYGKNGATGDNRDFLHNVKHLFKLEGDNYFFNPLEGVPEMKKTPLFYMSQVIGGFEGAMGEEWSHWPDLIHEAFPSVFVHRAEPISDYDDEEDAERVLPSVKNTYQSRAGTSYMQTSKFNNTFQADPDDDAKTARIKQDLIQAITDAQISEGEEDDLLDRFEDGKVVYIEFPQGTGKRPTAEQAEDVSEEEYMLDKLPEGMTLDEYLGGYEQDTLPVTTGHSALITPMLTHNTNQGNPNHYSADFDHHWIRGIENENRPKDTILALRHARMVSDNIGGVSRSRAKQNAQGDTLRRVGDSTFGRDVKGIEGGKAGGGAKGKIAEGKKKQSVHSSQVTKDEADNRMLMLHTLLFQAHHGIDNYNEEDHATHNTKQTMPQTVYTSKHRDPLGRGEDAGTVYQNELLSATHEDNPFDATIAVYDKEEYEKALERYEKGGILRLPTTLTRNIKDRRELVSELEKIHQESNGSVFDELGDGAKNRLRVRMKQEEGFTGHYGGGKQYIIGEDASTMYQEALANYRQLARMAYKGGSIEAGVNFDRLATEQGQHLADERGEIPPVTKDELRKNYLDDANETHKQAVAASEIMKPLMKWANPDLFQTHTPEHSNQAWADTAMLAQLCETWTRTLSPQERKHWINNARVSCSRDGGQNEPVMKILREHLGSKGMKKDAIRNEINRMVKDVTMPLYRQTWQGGNVAANVDLGEDKSVMNLLQKYVDGELNSNDYPPHESNELVAKIFDEVRKVLPKDATSQDFADALHARYIPHRATAEEEDEKGEKMTTGGQNLMVELPASSIVDFGQGIGRMNEDTGDFHGSVYNYKASKGGHHHEAELDEDTPLMSGGAGIRRKGEGTKPDYSMYAEIKALNRAYHTLLKHSKGTANGIEAVPRETAPLPKMGKGSDKGFSNLTDRMGNFIERIKADTKGVMTEIGKINTQHEEVGTGGAGVNEIQLPAVHTCPRTKGKFGHVIRPTHRYSAHALKQNRLIIHDKDGDFHQGGATLKASMDPYALRDFNSELLPYDIPADGNTQFPPVAMQPSGIAGQTVNSNYPVFSDMGGGQEALKSDIELLDTLTDDTLIFKNDGRPVPVKSMHRIFDVNDLKLLRGFSGDWIASHIPKGEPIILQKKGKRLKAYNADMKLVELTDEMDDEMDKVNDKDFVVHAVIDEEKIYFIDLLEAADEKTHNMPAKDRVRHLRAHFESSEHIKMPEPYNTKRADDEGLEEAIHLLREESPSDILLRDASATYMRGEIRHPKWILLSKEKKVDVIILDRKGMNYRIGVGPIMHPEHYDSRAVEIDGEHYMDVGSAKGPRGYDKGEYISVFCTGVSSKGDEYPTYTIRSARVDRDAHPQAADSVETLSMMLNESKIPHKVRLNKGAIHVSFPSLDDEVIYKVNEEEEGWMLEPHNTLWGHGEEYFIKLSEDMRPHWTPIATLLLKIDKDKREVKPEAPAGHTKKRKHILPEEEEIIKRGLEMAELMLERVSKEKITSTGIEGLGLNYGGADVESPRGPTENINDDTMPDFDPASRDYKEKPATGKKKHHIRTTEGEEAITDNRGNITITEPRV